MKKNLIFAAGIMLFGLTSLVLAKPNEAQLKQIAEGIVESLNSGDFDQRGRFLKKYYVNADSASAIERWQGHLERFSQELVKLRYITLMSQTRHSCSCLLRPRIPAQSACGTIW